MSSRGVRSCCPPARVLIGAVHPRARRWALRLRRRLSLAARASPRRVLETEQAKAARLRLQERHLRCTPVIPSHDSSPANVGTEAELELDRSPVGAMLHLDSSRSVSVDTTLELNFFFSFLVVICMISNSGAMRVSHCCTGGGYSTCSPVACMEQRAPGEESKVDIEEQILTG
uniref:Uncharacterized protein n=1 Tax=Leersia perrieri TaxID=77586 RepID=A0A0D9VWM8_9ORYZ